MRLRLYNTSIKQVSLLRPLKKGHIGLYVCGPTVYGPPHFGHGRSAVVFDLLVRHLKHSGYKVSYVRNITDVGHLLGDADEGEDKVGQIAKKQQSDPMAVAQHYTNLYHDALRRLNVLPPDIEPRATGHIQSQISLVQQLLDQGWAYETNGSVYFDLIAYRKKYTYGILSRRDLEEMWSGTRVLVQTEEKRHPLDFALWKKASPDHLMRWSSPWGDGFPGWHLECTAMSSQYLGKTFDIHGGGLDLTFPHHECEIAQSMGAYGVAPAQHWMHHNMVTIQQKKMSKSAGNFITLDDCFAGNHPLLSQAYEPMVVRLWILKTHYRHVLDCSDDSLQAVQASYYKFVHAYGLLQQLTPSTASSPQAQAQVNGWIKAAHAALDEDLNTPQLLQQLIAMRKLIFSFPATPLDQTTLDLLKHHYKLFFEDILGIDLTPKRSIYPLIHTLIEAYKTAKADQSYAQVDALRVWLRSVGVALQDTPNGVTWRLLAPISVEKRQMSSF